MPEFSLHLPRLLRFRRSHSRSPKSLTGPCDDPGIPHPPGPSAPPALPTPLQSEQTGEAVSDAPCPVTPTHAVVPQNVTSRLFVDKAPDAFGREHLWAPRPVVPIDAAELYSVPTATGFVTQHAPYLMGSTLSAQSPASQHSPAPSLQQSLNSQHLTPPLSRHSPLPQAQNQGMFKDAHNFTMMGSTFIDGNTGNITLNTNIGTPPGQFMEKLLENTIPGAEFDSSDRDPPPRCHPGTRLAVLQRCLYFISNCDGVKKMRWVVGAAGVGKSAIMQNVAESPDLPVNYHASVFFSINGRNDGTKAVITLSYQFAAKCEQYRQVIEQEITRDPSILRSSMMKQFNKLIVEPFIKNPQLKSSGRVLIIIDGLDECNNPNTQLELLRLISDFCITNPSSPVVWLIASRPETHITSFFSRRNVIPAYEKEEIPVDSDEARADVERFLRDKLTEIREASDSLDPQWPDEQDFWKLASASGGLFAYAHTAIRYIGDSTIGSPVSQLSDVLKVIDEHPMPHVPREEHPMALLDALYARILSNVPPKIMINTRKLLLALASAWDDVLVPEIRGSFVILCNWLGMTRDEAYAAINHLRSVLHVPRRDDAHKDELKPFHKSFIDYISDPIRSGFSTDIKHESQELKNQYTFRIFNEAPDGINFKGANYRVLFGILMCGPGAGDKISLTWPIGDEVASNNPDTRLTMYKLAMGEVVGGMGRGDPIFQTEFCIRLIITRFQSYRATVPHNQLRDVVFDESRRPEFMMHEILKPMPLEAIKICELIGTDDVKLQFRHPVTTAAKLSDPWHLSCEHKREGEWEEGKDQNWRTTFRQRRCDFCYQRFRHQVENWSVQYPDHALVLFTSTGRCCVEIRFVDPEDGMSEWIYWFWCQIPLEERQKYGSTV